MVFFSTSLSLAADPLVDYVTAPDTSFQWAKSEERNVEGLKTIRLDLTSQTWREHPWTHQVLIVSPEKLRNPDIALVMVSGDGDPAKLFSVLKTVANQAGAIAAAVNRVPNQPLYEGRSEDALIAYTYEQYARTGDRTWPLLFPMTKSAVRTMDTIQELARKELNQKIGRFVVTGASKRGWTTWLTAAADKRVIGIAPMVIDMLDMKAQTQWARKMYGRQSEEIKDYTEYNFDARMDEPRMVELRRMVDPYFYRERYKMPKLILLGTNDPYWVVDALRHYWDALPEPKLVFQTPNAGHDLAGGKEAIPTLAAFYQMIADRESLPTMSWTVGTNSSVASLDVKLNVPARQFRLWTAHSRDRDFRNDTWTSKLLESGSDKKHVRAQIEKPADGYQAYLVEAELLSASGAPYKLSTEARVIPDGPPAP